MYRTSILTSYPQISFYRHRFHFNTYEFSSLFSHFPCPCIHCRAILSLPSWQETMRNTNTALRPHRKSSADQPRSPNSLEPDASFFLRRRRTNKSSQPDAYDSEPVSPRFGAHLSKPTTYNSNPLEVDAISTASSLTLGSKFPLNVSDWNERVQRETRAGSGDFPPRNPADPPRPAKEGHEWVWFPEGYWAEREKLERKPSRRWFQKSSDRQSASSLSPKSIKSCTPNNVDSPGIKIVSPTSHGSSSHASQTTDDKSSQTANTARRIKRGFSFIAPTRPYFTSRPVELGAVFCKVKKGLETKVTSRPDIVRIHTSTAKQG